MAVREMDIRSRLDKLKKQRKLVKFVTDIPGTVPQEGFILDVSDSWVLFHSVECFHLDGYCVIRIDDIATAESGKFAQTLKRFLRAEGIMNEVGIETRIQLDDLQTIMESIRKLRKNVSISCDYTKTDDFFIGAIVRVGRTSVTLREFETTGKWASGTTNVAYRTVSMITFDDEYTNVWSRQIRPM